MRFAFLLLLLALPAAAQRESPPATSQTAITETWGAIAETDGWCVATNAATTIDLDAAAPARITAVMKRNIRFITIRFVAGATSTRICHKLGTASGVLQANSCVALGANSAGVITDGQVASYAVGRDFKAGALVALESQANAGTDGFVCVGVAW